MTSSEMVDVKEPGLDKQDSPSNINLNDALLEGEPKPKPQPQNPTPTSTSTSTSTPTPESHDTPHPMDHTPSPQQQDKDPQMPDPTTPETLLNQPSLDLTPPTKPNATHDDPQDIKFKSEDNDHKAPHETNIDPLPKQLSPSKNDSSDGIHPFNDNSPQTETKPPDDEKEKGDELKHGITDMDLSPPAQTQKQLPKLKLDEVDMKTPNNPFLLVPSSADGYESGTEEEQAAFMKEVETFYRDNNLEFKAPKFYKEELNLLKLWRAVIKLGGYEQVTSCKLWRQVGESFKPPKTCTTVSWTFRIFYEKALLEYEKHKMRSGELPFSDGPLTESIRVENQSGGNQALGSGRARRDAAARAMQGWHSQRLLDNGQVCHPIIKNKNLSSTPKGDKQLKTNGLLKRKKPTIEHSVHVGHMKTMKQQGDTMVIDIGPPADWVKINVQRTTDCFEIYALVPGLLREEVHVQSDPAGRLIISGQPEQLDNPWGVTPFKKVVSLPSRIDPHQTSAVVTLHGQLFVRVPFEQSDL